MTGAPEDTVGCVVVGAGVVGLAVARALAGDGHEVIVLEAAGSFGTETSSRNSEVIHAGIYYPAGSLMATLCVEGKARLYAYAEARGVPHRRCGKLIVACDAAEAERLEGIRLRAASNGVTDLTLLSGAEARALEPALRVEAALLSPSTGIIDSHAYMQSLLADAEAAGAVVAYRSPLEAATVGADGFTLRVGGAEPTTILARRLVNAAGLNAPALARRIEGLDPSSIPTPYLCKGNYFALAGRSPFRRLIYPAPVPGGLGTHLTLDMAGAARFGPDVEWIDTVDYAVDARRAATFEAAIRRWWPGLPDEALLPAYAGLRPKIVPPQVATQDFRIDGPERHGLDGLVNLYGIESPGLTASLAIAERVRLAFKSG
jgi:L-2-hydroxyglutarate oxidase LhgO